VKQGEFYALLPPVDDIHYVTTVSDTASVSIHLLANDTACARLKGGLPTLPRSAHRTPGLP
jgi:hypothetical protein